MIPAPYSVLIAILQSTVGALTLWLWVIAHSTSQLINKMKQEGLTAIRASWHIVFAVLMFGLGCCQQQQAVYFARVAGSIVTLGTIIPARLRPIQLEIFEMSGTLQRPSKVLLLVFCTNNQGCFEALYRITSHYRNYLDVMIGLVAEYYLLKTSKYFGFTSLNALHMERHLQSSASILSNDAGGYDKDSFTFVIHHTWTNFKGRVFAQGCFSVFDTDTVAIYVDDHRCRPKERMVYKLFVGAGDASAYLTTIPPFHHKRIHVLG